MKKSLFVIGALALLFTSCSKNTEFTTNDDAISFKVVNHNMRSMVTGTTFPTTEDFRVFAYFNENLPANTDVCADFGTKYIDDKDFTHIGDGIWAGGSKGTPNPYYWPKTGSMVFAGYHGTADVSFTPADDTQLMSIAGYQASYKQLSADNMNDLMYCPVTDKSYNNKGTDAAVEVVFAHALSWLEFQVKANDAADGYFRIDSIKILNVNPKGDATIEGTQSDYSCSWETTGTAATINQFKGKGGVVPSAEDSVVVKKGDAQHLGDDYVVIPQALDDITLVISYSQKTTGVEGGAWLKQADSKIALKGLKDAQKQEITDWESGKHYIYTISFIFDAEDEITIAPTVVDWDVVTLADIEI